MDKVFRIGIDKISLYNFEIKKICKGLVVDESNENYTQKTTHVRDEIFSLDSSLRLYENGETKEFNRITFNPNKIITGSNIINSRKEELNLAFESLEEKLGKKGIEIDFKESKIAEIEINLNVNIEFKEYFEVFLLLFTQKKNSKATFNNTNTIKLKEKLKSENFFYVGNSIKIKAYDKTAEIDNKDVLSEPVTRVEYTFDSRSYGYFTKKIGYDNSFFTLLNNIEIIDWIFINYIKKDFIKKSFDFLENRIKKTLESEYIAFKETGKLARLNNKKVPRNVYKYLEEFWIFDYSFVIEIVKKYDKKNKTRETERVKKLLTKHNNLRKFNYIVEIFLSSLISFSEE